MYFLMYNGIKNKNMSIKAAFKLIEINNKRNKFIDSFIKSNAVYASINDTIFYISNCPNNFILKFFKQQKLSKYQFNWTH